jgi:hypothetical protein
MQTVLFLCVLINGGEASIVFGTRYFTKETTFIGQNVRVVGHENFVRTLELSFL